MLQFRLFNREKETAEESPLFTTIFHIKQQNLFISVTDTKKIYYKTQKTVKSRFNVTTVDDDSRHTNSADTPTVTVPSTSLHLSLHSLSHYRQYNYLS